MRLMLNGFLDMLFTRMAKVPSCHILWKTSILMWLEEAFTTGVSFKGCGKKLHLFPSTLPFPSNIFHSIFFFTRLAMCCIIQSFRGLENTKFSLCFSHLFQVSVIIWRSVCFCYTKIDPLITYCNVSLIYSLCLKVRQNLTMYLTRIYTISDNTWYVRLIMKEICILCWSLICMSFLKFWHQCKIGTRNGDISTGRKRYCQGGAV